MDRIRRTLYEASVIFLAGVSIALCVVGILNYLHRPTLASFSREYKPGTLEEQVAVADTYLQWFTPRELNLAIEQQNTDTVCHGQAHALGRAVYKKYPNLGEVAKQCEGLCSYGCLHGAIMQMFSTDSDTLGGMIEEDTLQGYVEHIQRISDSLCQAPEVASVVKPRFCYHGLGHVFGFLYGTDPKRAMASCDYFTNPNAARSCRNGVLMEYVLAKPQKALLYTKDDSLCDSFPQYTSLCYRFKAYGWLYVWGGPKQALKGCDQFGEHSLDCIRNVAETASSPKIVSTEEGIESVCGGLIGEKRTICETGALRIVLTLNDGDDSEHACDPVVSAYREKCLQVREQFREEIYYED